MAKPKINIYAEAGKAVVKLPTTLTDFDEVVFEWQVNELIDKNINDVCVYMDGIGGDCFVAARIANIISKFKGTITGEIGAVCASAYTYIACKCSYVAMVANGNYMFHKPHGTLEGNEDEIAANLKLMSNITSEYLSTYVAKTGQKESAITKMWANDYWMNAAEALKLGFINEIIDVEAEINEDVRNNIVALGCPTPPEIKTTQQPIIMSKIPYIAAALNLPEGSGEPEIQAAVTKLVADLATAKAAQKAAEDELLVVNKERITALISASIKDGRITAAEEERYTKLATADFVETSALLADKKPHVSISAQLEIQKQQNDDKYKDWTFEKFQKEAPSVLAKIKETDTPRFSALLEDFKERNKR
jgi:ATP-dependent protease ClpP protease subunit